MVDTHVSNHTEAKLSDLWVFVLEGRFDLLIVKDLDELGNGILSKKWLNSIITESEIDKGMKE